MEQLGKVKGVFKSMSGGSKKLLLIVGAALIAFAVIAAIILNSGEASGYVPLYSGLTDQESTEVMAKLQEAGLDYQYRNDGTVTVPEAEADKTRATMALSGYPKSGFTYDTFLKNSNMMSTEADKKSLKTFDMQDRLAATIRLIDGVKDAVVQITPGEIQKYVLDNSEANVPTAAVMVTMKDGSSPTPEMAEAIQRLVAKSVENMDMGDVAVIDSNGIDVSTKKNDAGTSSGSEKMKFEQNAQLQIEKNVLNVLSPMFGSNNVRVSVKCTVDMQKTVSEENAYTAPNNQQNAGYITHQELGNESDAAGGTGGVPGAGTNTNVPQYNTQPAAGANYSSSTSSTDYALNQRKVQSQNDGGVISDVTVAVSINSAALGVDETKLISVIGSAAGIDPAVQAQKIQVINSSWPTVTVSNDNPNQNGGAVPGGNQDDITGEKYPPYLPYLVGGAGILALLVLILIFRGISKAKKKKRLALEQAMLENPHIPAGDPGIAAGGTDKEKQPVEIPQIVENEASRAVKDNIRGFTEENPEISAQLLKNWIRGGDEG